MLHTAHRPEDLSDKFTQPRCKTCLTFYLPYIQRELFSIFLLRLLTSPFPNRLLFESTRRAENDRCSWTRAVKDARTPLRFPLAWDKKIVITFSDEVPRHPYLHHTTGTSCQLCSLSSAGGKGCSWQEASFVIVYLFCPGCVHIWQLAENKRRRGREVGGCKKRQEPRLLPSLPG